VRRGSVECGAPRLERVVYLDSAARILGCGVERDSLGSSACILGFGVAHMEQRDSLGQYSVHSRVRHDSLGQYNVNSRVRHDSPGQ
jgi:hypothetical protein